MSQSNLYAVIVFSCTERALNFDQDRMLFLQQTRFNLIDPQ